MKIVLFGATGGTGRLVAAQALDAGYFVTAVARNPAALGMQHSHLTVMGGDVLSSDMLGPAIAGKDVVVSAIGTTNRTPPKIYSVGLKNILTAMDAAGVQRLLCVSASRLDPGPAYQKLFARLILWRVFKGGYTDLLKMEKIAQASDVDWTIIRPPRLTDGKHTGNYQIAVNHPLSHGSLVSRADLADYIVRHLDDPTTHRAMVEIAY
jgi:putative NADH-flavin reductase